MKKFLYPLLLICLLGACTWSGVGGKVGVGGGSSGVGAAIGLGTGIRF